MHEPAVRYLGAHALLPPPRPSPSPITLSPFASPVLALQCRRSTALPLCFFLSLSSFTAKRERGGRERGGGG